MELTTSESVYGLALCSGIGGLDLGVGLVVPGFRVVCHVERESFSAGVLVARMEDETMGASPVWDDIKTFDGRPWSGVVDIITAGFPCQPVSFAGKRKGEKDERWLWGDVARIIREVAPEVVFLENVPGLLSGGFGPVLGDLAKMGFDAEWGVFSAGGCGAPHRRERVFVLAYRDGGRREGPRLPGSGWDKNIDATRRDPKMGNAEMPDGRYQQGRNRAGECQGPPGDGSGNLPYWPPGPSDREEWQRVIESDPTTQPAICGMVDGIPEELEQSPDAYRVDRLRALGNGVVPIVAATAFITLAKRR